VHHTRIAHVLYSGHRGNILAPTARLHGCEFLFVLPQPRDSPIPFAFDLHEDLIKPRIIRLKKERTTEIDADRVRTRAKSSHDVADVDCEKAD
jgi:hypothetical protein